MSKSHPVFGDAEVHPVTGRHIEKGVGALPYHVQVAQHLREIEAESGRERADEMRAAIKALEAEEEDKVEEAAEAETSEGSTSSRSGEL